MDECRAIREAAEIACIENVNESKDHNERLQFAVETFVKYTSEYAYHHQFPFVNCEWQEMLNLKIWNNILVLIKDLKAPYGYVYITKVATARLIVEHFSDKPIFAGGRVTKPKASNYEMDWGDTVNTTTTGRVTLHPGDTLSVSVIPPGTTITNAASPFDNLFTTKEKAMSTKAIKVSNVTFVQVDGSTRVDIKDISLETAVSLIQQSENAIIELSNLKAQPKAVTKRIAELQGGIDALVKELDSREA